jgi:hypothetical protein
MPGVLGRFVSKEEHDAAGSDLENWSGFNMYLNTYQPINKRWPFGDHGIFTVVRLQQLAIEKGPGMFADDDGKPETKKRPLVGTRACAAKKSRTLYVGQPEEVLSDPEPSSKDDFRREPAEDEQEVNAVLVNFLIAISAKVSTRHCWSPKRQSFRAGQGPVGAPQSKTVPVHGEEKTVKRRYGYSAEVDGLLRQNWGMAEEKTLAIIEVKRDLRAGAPGHRVARQEAAELAAWIATQPPDIRNAPSDR